jgi:hypothetical protein
MAFLSTLISWITLNAILSIVFSHWHILPETHCSLRNLAQIRSSIRYDQKRPFIQWWKRPIAQSIQYPEK